MQIFFLLFTACTDTNTQNPGDIFNDYANNHIDSTPVIYDSNIHHENEYMYDGYFMSNTSGASPDIIEKFLKKHDEKLSDCAWVYNVIWVLPKDKLALEKVSFAFQGEVDAFSEFSMTEDTLLYYNRRDKHALGSVVYTVACGDCEEPVLEQALSNVLAGQCLPVFKTPSKDYRESIIAAGERAKY